MLENKHKVSYRYFLRRFCVVLVATLIGCSGFAATALAACSNPDQQSCSPTYGVNEVYFGTGGALCDPANPSTSEHSSGSTGYCAKVAVGETGVGATLGTIYQAQAGFNTNREPSLAVLINDTQCNTVYSSSGSSFNLSLTTSTVQHVTANFSVLSYLASGYVVQTVGSAPSYTSGTTHTLTTLSNAGISAGTEDFGMNLAANTGFGHVEAQLPDTTFGFGAANAGYNTANQYSYTNGAQIASSAKSSGVTCYFPSYVFAISATTPAGTYTFNQSIVVTSTY